MDLTTWTQVLGLPSLEVVAAERIPDGKGWQLSVIPTQSVALCPQCKQASGSRHSARWQIIHDLPIAGQPLRLSVQTVEFKCAPCGRYFTVHPLCVLEGTHVTVRLAEALTECVNVSTLSAAAVTYHVPESTVKVIFEKIIQQRCQKKASTLKPITKLGIDEVHLEVHDDAAEPCARVQPEVPQTPVLAEGEKSRRG
jgi:transposase